MRCVLTDLPEMYHKSARNMEPGIVLIKYTTVHVAYGLPYWFIAVQGDFKVYTRVVSLVYLMSKELWTPFWIAPTLNWKVLIEWHWRSIWSCRSQIAACNRFSKIIQRLLRIYWLTVVWLMSLLFILVSIRWPKSLIHMMIHMGEEKNVQWG